MGSQIVQALLNTTSWARIVAEAVIALVALGLVVAAFGRSQGSMTRVLVIVGGALVAAVVVWQLPDWLQIASHDAPGITGVGSRY